MTTSLKGTEAKGDDAHNLDNDIPYRLPSLCAPEQAVKVDDGDKIILSLPTVRLDMHSLQGVPPLKTHPPYTAGQMRRAESIHAPKFNRAHLAPEYSGSLPYLSKRSDGMISPDVQQISISKKITRRSAPAVYSKENTVRPAFPTSHRKVVWKLSPHPHMNYDAQSLKGIMGPYSREFVVHYSTPKTWLRMKLSKSF
ncbi:hypothetical protein HOLleu_41461 [Holothuria leucospilota]|uniref:Uncharacterized protein n=1 Tax=Holothuria leucospilota TaxID=206669 RepID=A0A9Q0YCJ0_HOLLE|nr:hypothetical protein HOLleu_41461 [Holothuria leucospilota]